MEQSDQTYVSASGFGTVPVPDPTTLTTQQLLREIATSREVIEVHIDGIKNVLETRLNGMDKAIDLLQSSTNKMSDLVTGRVNQLQALHEERFRSIATQFTERDTRSDQTVRESKIAVDAALQAAKEAVGEQNKSNAVAIAKSEMAFTKQIDQIGILITAIQNSFNDKIDDVKTRVQAIESQRRGIGEAYGLIIGVVTAIIAVITVVVVVSRK